MNKFKYIPFSIEHIAEEMTEYFQEVDSPLPYNNLPDGEYLIRGNKREHRKKYWKVDNRWFLTEDVVKDNGHYYCDSTIYGLFPMLPHREYVKLKEVGFKRLNKTWQRHVHGYFHWLELREITLGIRKSRLAFDKQFNAEE